MKITKAMVAFTALMSLGPIAFAQPSDKAPERTRTQYGASIDCKTLPTRLAATDCAYQNSEFHTFHLANVTQQNDANEILVAIRNIVEPSTKIFLIANQSAIVTYTYPANTERIAKIIQALDVAHKTYRITYTFTDAQSSASLFPRISVLLGSGQDAVFKRGEKIPVALNTGAAKGKTDSTAQGPQYTYLDVGVMVDTSVEQQKTGAFVKYRIEQSSIAQASKNAFFQDPVVDQTTLSGASVLTLNKPQELGTIEMPGTKQNVTITAQLEEVP